MSESKASSSSSAAPQIDHKVGATKETTLQSCFVINRQDGSSSSKVFSIPAVGLGVYQIDSNDCKELVLSALKDGYRHVDTAKVYGNEEAVGQAIKESGIQRSELFITTKLWNSDHGYQQTLDACQNSLKRLGLDYVDLYLIHWPVANKRLDTWKAMEKLYETGQAKAIGVSNYMVHHLEELLANCKIKPFVNQIELSPYLTREDVVKYCQKNDIIVEAYSPLTKGIKLKDQKLVDIAKQYNKSTAQLLLRWALQKGYVILPRSSKSDRITENAQLFDFHISAKDMEKLDSFNEGLTTGWDPTNAP